MFLLASCGKEIPHDADIKRNFLDNKEVFERYVGVFIDNESKGLLSMESFPIESERKLMLNIEGGIGIDSDTVLIDMKEKLKVDLISVNEFQSGTDKKIGEISFYSYRGGIVTAGRAKGISFFVHGKPNYIEDSLSKYEPPVNAKFPEGVSRIYTDIENGWYLFVD